MPPKKTTVKKTTVKKNTAETKRENNRAYRDLADTANKAIGRVLSKEAQKKSETKREDKRPTVSRDADMSRRLNKAIKVERNISRKYGKPSKSGGM